MTLHPLVDLVRRQFAIDDTDDDGAIAAKLERGVDEVGADLARAVPYLRKPCSRSIPETPTCAP
jgi:hypothetical protein